MHSPVPNKPVPIITPKKETKPFDFYQAIKQVHKGKKVSRLAWEDKNEYALMHNEFLSIHTKGKTHQWAVHETDMIADDWFII